MTVITYRALVDLVVAGKGVKANSTFETSAEQAGPALAFGLAEPVEDEPKSKPAARRHGHKEG